MTILCHIDELPENMARGFKLDDNSYFAIKRQGQIYLYRNRCPHLGIELNWMKDKFFDLDGMMIQCFTHGALFLVEDGECVAGPCLGQKLQAIPFRIVDQQLILDEQPATKKGASGSL
jgi:nitrite reductase/ring-hydroxylating ferredoxin subunit